jgi:hypothetical protein
MLPPWMLIYCQLSVMAPNSCCKRKGNATASANMRSSVVYWCVYLDWGSITTFISEYSCGLAQINNVCGINGETAWVNFYDIIFSTQTGLGTFHNYCWCGRTAGAGVCHISGGGLPSAHIRNDSTTSAMDPSRPESSSPVHVQFNELVDVDQTSPQCSQTYPLCCLGLQYSSYGGGFATLRRYRDWSSQEYLTSVWQVLGGYEKMGTLPDMISNPGSHFAVLDHVKII